MSTADRMIEVFNEAKARPAGAERDEFLAAACGNDAALQEQVRSLLRADAGAGEFLHGRPVLPPGIERELARLKPEEAGDRIGNYKLLQEIGEGGFGKVWMAEQLEPVSRRVALKIIKLGMDTSEVIARFEQERQALAMMDHPNIARVFDAGATQFGRPYFAMELVRGVPVTQYCDEAGLGTRERLALFGDVCAAINHAHQKGVIHRDIKPSNVMITLHGDKPVAKVIDFGIAKATQGRLTDKTLFTRFEQFIGTPVYMSPEQASLSGLDIDTRSDIYSLGVLLYELLTGQPPFDPQALSSAGYDEMRRIIREVEPPKPSLRISTLRGEERATLARARQVEAGKLGRLVEPDLDWIVMKAIDKDRTRRYETANGLALDIQHFLADEPVSAGPPTARYKFRKFARRHKAAFRLGAAFTTVLIAATVVSTWQAVRATRAEKKIADTLVQVAAERDAKELARQDAEDIAKFLVEVFQSTDPNHDGRTITVAETLDRAAKKLETDLTTQPGQRAKLQATIGRTYYALGLVHQASPLLEKVRDYHLTHAGPEHPDTLKAMQALADSYAGADRHDDALKLRGEALALCRKVHGPEHPDTLAAIAGLMHSYSAVGRRDEALKLREELLALRRKALGAEHPDTVAAIRELMLSYADAGRWDEALDLQQKMPATYRKAPNPIPPTIVTMPGLADQYFLTDRYNEALKLREEVLERRRRELGPVHLDTVEAMQKLATSYVTAGRLDDALKLEEGVLAVRRKVLGPEHPDTIEAMRKLAISYVTAARLDDAIQLRERLLAQHRSVLGPQHVKTLGMVHLLALSYVSAGRTPEALPLFAEYSSGRPEDTNVAVTVAALQVWFGQDAEYAATRQRMLTWAADTTIPESARRAAKLACLRPETEATRREAALLLARKGVALGEGTPSAFLNHLSLGMAEFRSGLYPAADATLAAAGEMASAATDKPYAATIEGTARFYRAMSLFLQGKPAEARDLFTATEAWMKPLPSDEKNPLANAAHTNDLVLWLACKEARALLKVPPAGQP